ncbi:hypothetical protein G4B88_018209 [Cannabis sativa]|uniref:Retrotransposon gag domain-containing protein n=1 Tax=Cannabis sativa TaxID=3483 RepID=A0A7J6G972_CANSA|nr:hypothetical protein G4B88_018209 [Cannabis sativa]
MDIKLVHISDFNTLIHAHQVVDDLKCVLFPITLTRAAKTWFMKFKRNSITSWDQLSCDFKKEFCTAKARILKCSFFNNVKQQPGESLKDHLLFMHATSRGKCPSTRAGPKQCPKRVKQHAIPTTMLKCRDGTTKDDVLSGNVIIKLIHGEHYCKASLTRDTIKLIKKTRKLKVNHGMPAQGNGTDLQNWRTLATCQHPYVTTILKTLRLAQKCPLLLSPRLPLQ